MLLKRCLAARPGLESHTHLLTSFLGWAASSHGARSASTKAAGRGSNRSSDSVGASSPPGRRKLFQDVLEDYPGASTAAHQVLPPALPASTIEAGTAAAWQQAASTTAALQTQPQQQRQQQQQQQQLEHQAVSWPADVQLHVYWDLDNLPPTEWLELPALIQRLKNCLQQYGSIAAMHACACTRTLTQQVPGSSAALVSAFYDGSKLSASSSSSRRSISREAWGFDEVIDAVATADALRCPLCHRRSSSLVELNKHFGKLHQREHEKRLKGPRYIGSDKEKRYKAAVQHLALPRARLAGAKGQAVQLLLQQGNVQLMQVVNGNQAADVAINSHINKLCKELPSLQDRALVIVSDDRGFRKQLGSFLQAGGAGVLLVTARQPEQWNTRKIAEEHRWLMSADDRVVFVDWERILGG